jgi:hypothetical protein
LRSRRVTAAPGGRGWAGLDGRVQPFRIGFIAASP